MGFFKNAKDEAGQPTKSVASMAPTKGGGLFSTKTDLDSFLGYRYFPLEEANYSGQVESAVASQSEKNKAKINFIITFRVERSSTASVKPGTVLSYVEDITPTGQYYETAKARVILFAAAVYGVDTEDAEALNQLQESISMDELSEKAAGTRLECRVTLNKKRTFPRIYWDSAL